VSDEPLSCPLPGTPQEVLLAHGGGGRLMHQLLEQIILPAFDSEPLRARHDGAVIELGGAKLAFATDGYVVSPLFFPGGDIGELAIYGTVNDLAMCGARPRWLSAAFVLEEGLPLETLERVVASMRAAAAKAGVEIATGDTKVVDRGKGDGVFVTTAGVGLVEHDRTIAPTSVCPGDAILLSGDLGRHGAAILIQREELGFEAEVESDCAPLHEPVLALLQAGLDVHCLRDLTRGGLASALCEVAAGAGLTLEIEESALPVGAAVRSVCEVLGLDPCHVANEGRFVCFLPADQAEAGLEVLRAHEVSAGAVRLGLAAEGRGEVHMRTALGSIRLIEMLSGEQLPRIC
jgi:hydrogenase expression/formation protein HypE